MQTKLIFSLIACVSFVDTMFASQYARIEPTESLQNHCLVARVSSKKLFEDVDSESEYDLGNVCLTNNAIKIYLYLQDFPETENGNSCARDSIDVIDDYFLINADEVEIATPHAVYEALGLSYFDGEKEIE